MYFDDNKKLTIPTVCRKTYHSSPKHIYKGSVLKSIKVKNIQSEALSLIPSLI